MSTQRPHLMEVYRSNSVVQISFWCLLFSTLIVGFKSGAGHSRTAPPPTAASSNWPMNGGGSTSTSTSTVTSRPSNGGGVQVSQPAYLPPQPKKPLKLQALDDSPAPKANDQAYAKTPDPTELDSAEELKAHPLKLKKQRRKQ